MIHKFKILIILLLIVAINLVILSVQSEKEDIKEKCIAITFDDGYDSDYTIVSPLLKKFNYTATFFIISSKINTTNRLELEELKELSKDYEIGSHSLNHLNIWEANKSKRTEEFNKSKEYFTNNDIPIKAFSFPYSSYTKREIMESKEFYSSTRTDDITFPIGIEKNTNMEKLCKQINKSEERFISLILHSVDKDGQYTISEEKLITLFNCLNKTNIKVDTFSGCHESTSTSHKQPQYPLQTESE